MEICANKLFLIQGEPQSKSNITALSIYLLVSLFFVLGSMIQFAIVLFIEQMSEVDNDNHPLRQIAPSFKTQGNESKIVPFEKAVIASKKKNVPSKSFKLTRKIDYVSFVFFNLTYLLFNLSYFIYYN